jgi:peptide/nickel transport system substrate-binding protein
MRRPTRWIVVLTVALVASACTFGDSPDRPPGPAGTRTVRIGLMANEEASGLVGERCSFRVCGQTYDPQSTPFMSAFELARCCFMRTLMSYDLATPNNSTTLAPDLAAEPPTVSSDGLLWTFRLRRGIHYAPPMADTEIVAADFIRSIERAMTPESEDGTIGGYYVDTYLPDVIVGAHEFTDGEASLVSGLQAPDPYTLQVHLTEPTGDLGYRLAVPGLGPIPANPDRPDDPLGVAQGHDFDYGDVIVSSGPYMFEGSELLDHSPAPLDQIPATGNGGDVMVLVRNPAWSRDTDHLRRAWADRLEFYRVQDARSAERLIRTGAVDTVLNWSMDAETVDRWRADPDLRDRLFTHTLDGGWFISINLAMRPFDDLHVRRAMNMAVDRDLLVQIARRRGVATEAQLHIAVDGLEDNLLIDYDPFGVGTSGDPSVASDEMAMSSYDTDADGRCDVAECRSIPLVVPADDTVRVAVARAFAIQMRPLGLDVDVRPVDDPDNPGFSYSLRLASWYKDFPDAATFFPVLFAGESDLFETSLGHSPTMLARSGYEVTSVPSVDPQLEQCAAALFQAQVRCWARLDTYMSEHIVPWVPVAVLANGWAVSDRLQTFAIDSSTPIPMPAPDSLEVGSGATAPAPIPPSPTSVPDIPAGLYRTRITLEDIARYDGQLSEEDLNENLGTYTILIRDGQYTQHATASHPIFNPIQLGTYQGEGDHVRFEIQAPFPDGVFADLRWRVDGDDLRFTVERCRGYAAQHADLCALVKAFYESRPWVLVRAL